MTRQYVTAKARGELQGQEWCIKILASGGLTAAGDVCLRVTAPPTDDHRAYEKLELAGDAVHRFMSAFPLTT